MKLEYLNLNTTDPFFNLAAEQYVFDQLPRDRAYCMLWQNDNTIVIGKYQNTLAEINEEFVRRNGIHVVRRLSGGGAVYHDLGNLNFTFITDAGSSQTLDFQLFCGPVIRTLRKLGVEAEINGRNDITIGGKKFSGNSQYLKQDRVMHHGTILFDSNLSVVEEALNVDPEKIQAKGVRSVRSRVTNVRPHLPQDRTLEEFRIELLANILRKTSGREYQLSEVALAQIHKLRTERYTTWEWNYGCSPECTLFKKQRFEGCGTVEAYLTIERGAIVKAEFHGDFFSVKEPSELAEYLVGCRPERKSYAEVLSGLDISHYFLGLTQEMLLELLCG